MDTQLLLQKAKDIGERVVLTFVLTFLSLLPIGTTIGYDTAKIALVGAWTAALSLLFNLILTVVQATNGKTWWQDALLRTAVTFIQVTIAVVFVNGTTDFRHLGPALIAALPSVAVLLKSAIASQFGDHTTAGFLASSQVLPIGPAAQPEKPAGG